MARGSNTFYTLFGEEYELPEDKPVLKGRSATKIELRNELLLHRYYFYGRFTPFRYDLVLQHLESEFFLEPRTIQDIITASVLRIRAIKQSAPTVKELRARWSWMDWTPPL